ncbi:MAG: hypothetical protein ACUVRA_03115 [Candidatus Bathyarchaeaceae archaeon]
MTGVTIDHLIATTAFLAAILVFTGLFTQSMQAAILYEENRHVALKASDLLDTILLSPGYPYHWGEGNITLSCFGLQEPRASGYTLSSFALMRLLSISGDPVEYPTGSGIWYSNVSWGFGGGYLLVPVSECVSYETASRLLGVNGSYGFQLSITPTITINITETQLDPLKLKVEVGGVGFPLSEADINYLLYWVYVQDDQRFFNVTSGNGKTDQVGVAYLDFSANPRVDGRTAYTIIVYAQLSGLYGVGYRTREIRTKAGNIIPFIESYEDGTILLAHKWGKNDPGEECQGALQFNASFFVLSDDFELTLIQSWRNLVNYGQGKPYHRIQIPTSSMGFLIVTYWTGNQYGMIIMPWGISILGFSVLFGGNPAGNVWVATDLRQVTVDQVAYQAKIACWSLRGYQIWKPGWWW